MGGYGSGRWGYHSKKDTVENCRCLDIKRMVRTHIIRQGIWHSGTWVWSDSRTGETLATIAFEVNTFRESSFPWLRLHYKISEEVVNYKVLLQTTTPHFGGFRWWFICPIVKCGRRVTKLYLPAGGRYFGCRHCYHLTYRSAQEHDPRWSRLLKNTALLGRLMADMDIKKLPNFAIKGILKDVR